MEKIRESIVINRPVRQVFTFTLDPENTPKWIGGITMEQRNESPTKLGTIYKNQNSKGTWKEYEITKFIPDSTFVFSRKGASYHVQYTFKALAGNQCELEYCEWDESGDASELFDHASLKEVLTTLKNVIESQ